MCTVDKGLSLGYVHVLADHPRSWDFYSSAISMNAPDWMQFIW